MIPVRANLLLQYISLFTELSVPVACNQFQFLTGHPQKSTHALRKHKIIHIPVLSGTPIPRRDIEEQADKYAVVMLALFRPWTRSATSPLKAEDTSWKDSLNHLLSVLSKDKLDIMDHMQEEWECRLAADDFSAEYKARMASFGASSNNISTELNTANELGGDLDWNLGQF